MAHGYGGSRASWRGAADALKRAGYEVVDPSMPGQDASPDPSVGFGFKEAEVVVDSVNWARSQYPSKAPPKIILLGVSMGGAASWLASALIPDEVDAVITEGAYARFDKTMDRWMSQYLPFGNIILHPVVVFASRIGHVDPSSIVPVEAAAKWHKPALVIQAGNDGLILPENATQLSQAAQCPLWTVPHAEHSFCFDTDRKGYISHLLAIAKDIDKAR
jgi:pimeloyl-ACP methyl ester carboxylesterase